MTSLLQITAAGLYCAAGDFYVDPWQPVERAVITHAHADHATPGSREYLTATSGVELLRQRVQPEAVIEGLDYGATIDHRGVRVSLHPAGHVLGSSQVRIEQGGEVCVVSGDYKLASDPTCQPFEPVRCHTFVTESTFGLPIYRWRSSEAVLADVNAWWLANRERGLTSVVFAYALGKSQRLLAGLDPEIGPIGVHGAIERFLPIYRQAGVKLPATEHVTAENLSTLRGKGLIVAPPSAMNTPWLRKLSPSSTAIVSGWMQVRGMRRRRSVDRGFALSDHADWDGLLGAIRATGAENVWVTHGYVGPMVHWLSDAGLSAKALQTKFEGELEMENESEEVLGAGD